MRSACASASGQPGSKAQSRSLYYTAGAVVSGQAHGGKQRTSRLPTHRAHAHRNRNGAIWLEAQRVIGWAAVAICGTRCRVFGAVSAAHPLRLITLFGPCKAGMPFRWGRRVLA
jgi:hypothetical protein